MDKVGEDDTLTPKEALKSGGPWDDGQINQLIASIETEIDKSKKEAVKQGLKDILLRRAAHADAGRQIDAELGQFIDNVRKGIVPPRPQKGQQQQQKSGRPEAE